MEEITLTVLIAMLLVAIVSKYSQRHRILKVENDSDTSYFPQESTLFWTCWRNMQYSISPYTEIDYKFKTYAEAKKFLDSLHSKSNAKVTVIRYKKEEKEGEEKA